MGKEINKQNISFEFLRVMNNKMTSILQTRFAGQWERCPPEEKLPRLFLLSCITSWRWHLVTTHPADRCPGLSGVLILLTTRVRQREVDFPFSPAERGSNPGDFSTGHTEWLFQGNRASRQGPRNSSSSDLPR